MIYNLAWFLCYLPGYQKRSCKLWQVEIPLMDWVYRHKCASNQSCAGTDPAMMSHPLWSDEMLCICMYLLGLGCHHG